MSQNMGADILSALQAIILYLSDPSNKYRMVPISSFPVLQDEEVFTVLAQNKLIARCVVPQFKALDEKLLRENIPDYDTFQQDYFNILIGLTGFKTLLEQLRERTTLHN